jgi:hypothetical protein
MGRLGRGVENSTEYGVRSTEWRTLSEPRDRIRAALGSPARLRTWYPVLRTRPASRPRIQLAPHALGRSPVSLRIRHSVYRVLAPMAAVLGAEKASLIIPVHFVTISNVPFFMRYRPGKSPPENVGNYSNMYQGYDHCACPIPDVIHAKTQEEKHEGISGHNRDPGSPGQDCQRHPSPPKHRDQHEQSRGTTCHRRLSHDRSREGHHSQF